MQGNQIFPTILHFQSHPKESRSSRELGQPEGFDRLALDTRYSTDIQTSRHHKHLGVLHSSTILSCCVTDVLATADAFLSALPEKGKNPCDSLSLDSETKVPRKD